MDRNLAIFPTRNTLFSPPKGDRIVCFAGNTDLGLSSYPDSELVGGTIQEYQEATRRTNPITYVAAECWRACDFSPVGGGGHGHFIDPAPPRLTCAFLWRICVL